MPPNKHEIVAKGFGVFLETYVALSLIGELDIGSVLQIGRQSHVSLPFLPPYVTILNQDLLESLYIKTIRYESHNHNFL